jgi:hypothetical protein
MSLTTREWWTALHGMFLGAAFLLAFTGAAASLWTLRSEWKTPAGKDATARVLIASCWAMALLAWMTVVVGTFVIYPWYRATPPAGTKAAMLSQYPKSLLIAQPGTARWHQFGMEWKEHVGWLAPFFATGVAVVATRFRKTLADEKYLRQTMLVLLTAAFIAASVAGLFGAFINKMAPVR